MIFSKSNISVLFDYFKFIYKGFRIKILVLFLMLLSLVLSVVQPVITDTLSNIVDSFISCNYELFIYYLGIYTVIQIVSEIIENINYHYDDRKERLLMNYHSDVVSRKISKIDIESFYKKKENELIYTISNRSYGKIRSFFDNISSSLHQVVQSFIYILILYKISWIVPLLVFFSQFFFFLFNLKIKKEEFKMERKIDTVMRLQNFYENILTSRQYAKETRIYKTRKYFERNFFGTINEIVELRRRLTNSFFKRRIFSEGIYLIIKTICIFLIAFFAMKGQISIGELFFVFMSMDILTTNISGLINSFGELRKNFKYIELFAEFMRLPEIKVNTISFKKIESIEFENISYSYPNSDLILKKINFKINKGEKVLIFGKNGSGKSTFVKIFMGLLKPNQGYIKINNEEMHSNDLYNYVSYLNQDFLNIN